MSESDTVVAMPGVELPAATGPVNTDVVVELKRLLAQAESGEVVGIAYVKLMADNQFNTLWSFRSDIINSNTMLAGISVLQHRMLNASTR